MKKPSLSDCQLLTSLNLPLGESNHILFPLISPNKHLSSNEDILGFVSKNISITIIIKETNN